MPMSNEVFRFETGAGTDTGCLRDHNEDSFLSHPEWGLWVVADGMGGHSAGDFASQSITHEMQSIGVPGSADDLQARFIERLTRAHDRIATHAEALGGRTVGATVVGLLAFDAQFSCVWSGDSRIYLLRDGVLSQQTRDHTEVRELLEAGTITPEQARDWPRKNVITRAIGVSEVPDCDVMSGEIRLGDTFLLCSDGLTEHLEDGELATMLAGPDAQAVCNSLITETLARGARDNVTAIVVRAHAADPVDVQDHGY